MVTVALDWILVQLFARLKGYTNVWNGVLVLSTFIVLTVSTYHHVIIKAKLALMGCLSTLFKGFCQCSFGLHTGLTGTTLGATHFNNKW